MTAALQTRPVMTTSGDSGEAVFLLIKQHMNFHSYVKLLEAIYSGPEIYIDLQQFFAYGVFHWTFYGVFPYFFAMFTRKYQPLKPSERPAG
jgi:hypothetical protein